MATPDSSATSPSPPMAYLTQPALPPHSVNNSGAANAISHERDDRKKAVQKFMARAELSSVTRALRARLAYASFKATHNIPHVSLRDLEEQSSNQVHATPGSRSIAAKRKAGVTTTTSNYYGNSTNQTTGSRRSAPAHASSTQRGNYYPGIGGSGSTNPPNTATTSKAYVSPTSPSSVSTSGQSLYTSLLAPPPAKYARTIHNPSDPPAPAPARAINSPRARPREARPGAAAKSIAEGTRAHAKGRSRDDKPATPKTKRTVKGKQKQSNRRAPGATNDTESVDGDGDVDMKAAAALTSLLLHNHRGSASTVSAGAGSASSPRSSIDGAASEAGSTASFAHFLQSSTRSIADAAPSAIAPAPDRPHTPVGSVTSESQTTTTPRPDPTDNEAADLMLFLATSPSPARPATNKDRNSRDLAAFRALGSGVDRPKGRVLFPTAASSSEILDDASRNVQSGVGKPLARGGTNENSFASSISSISSYMGAESTAARPSNLGPRSGRSTPNNTSSQLLPPPSLPAPRNTASPPESKLPQAQGAPQRPAPQNPYPSSASSVDFNFNDFINASPSPRPSKTAASPFDPSGAPKPNLSLRADVGRKLFEEEQIRLGGLRRGLGQDSIGAPQLGAGIDLSS